MVYILNENVMLHICSKKEAAKSNQTVSQVSASSSGSTPTQKSSSNQAGSGIRIIKDAGSAVVSGQNAGQGASPVNGSGKININTASAAELDTLPGIGEATANDIISYREKNGPFKDIKDIMKIPRIKDSRFNAIKDLITVN
jgi:competence protein ComEA